MSKQWHVQQSTAEQLYEQTPDETVEELGDLDWLTWEWIAELAQSGSDNPEDGDCWIGEPTKEGDNDD